MQGRAGSWHIMMLCTRVCILSFQQLPAISRHLLTPPLEIAQNSGSQTDSIEKNTIRRSVISRIPVLWLGTALDGQTNSVKKYRIRLAVVNPSSVAGSSPDALDGQTNSVKKYRICLAVVNPSSVAGSERDHYDYESLSQSTTDGQFDY